ncbi:nucleoporin p58/p45-like isoform X2 [Babylonia areolata]|uniref:nucleoporin p58/p45-like isoform X2 n=1 Tax=Babylonia areolata TaxID=304850 RepID=UPI003FCF61FC
MATGGFNFGGFGGGATNAGTGFSFGAQKTTAAPTLAMPSLAPATTATSTLNFSLNPKTTAASTGLGGFSLPGAATKTTTAGGFSFGLTAPATTTATGGFSLGGTAAPTTTTAPSTGFSFGLTPGSSAATTTTATGAATGLPFGTATTTAGGGLGGFSFGNTTTSAPTLGLGGLGAATSTTAASIFAKTSTAPTFTGLGGVDPKTSSAGGAGGSGTSAEGKAVKEAFIPDQLVVTVDELQKYVKGEKAVREDIVRMSSKPLMRVQEDTAALKQLLSVVSNGLQRNACTLEKLKGEMTQELKNAEMAQRTKDIPPGLQYENTAPLEYFEQMVEQFEGQMLSYRQQIEMLESHLSALQQPVRHSPDEVFTLIRRQHESFIALAAHLQEIHEAIKVQKEQFLTYRRIFHGETKNIFQQPAPVAARPVQRRPVEIAGPTPFPGITNPAAAAMASVLNRPQQPHGPPVAGLMGPTGMGTAWFSGGGGGGPTAQGTSGGWTGGSLLGQPGAPGAGFCSTSFFGTGPTTSASSSSLASTLGSLNNTANASLNMNMSAATKQPFTLQKPPLGAKRGKR